MVNGNLRNALIWTGVGITAFLPIAVATTSPQIAWRDPVYIIAGFAGIIALSLLLLQPLLAARYLPGLNTRLARMAHRSIGGGLIIAVVIHVAALWITSPPDVIDALLFVSPTPFSIWGVIAMWALFLSGMVVALRRYWQIPWRIWRIVHTALAGIIVAASIAHVLPIEGMMETGSKALLCVLVFTATVVAVVKMQRDSK